MKPFFSLFLLFVAPVQVRAAAPLTPEECLNVRDASGVTVTHGGKTYRLAAESCKTEFLSDPERFAQLYDALLELRASGQPVAPESESLVPS